MNVATRLYISAWVAEHGAPPRSPEEQRAIAARFHAESLFRRGIAPASATRSAYVAIGTAPDRADSIVAGLISEARCRVAELDAALPYEAESDAADDALRRGLSAFERRRISERWQAPATIAMALSSSDILENVFWPCLDGPIERAVYLVRWAVARELQFDERRMRRDLALWDSHGEGIRRLWASEWVLAALTN